MKKTQYRTFDWVLDKTGLQAKGPFSSLVHAHNCVVTQPQWCLSQRICNALDGSSKLIMSLLGVFKAANFVRIGYAQTCKG